MIVHLLALSLVATADPAVKLTVHTGHFEKISSGLKGDASFQVFTEFAAFEKVLGVVPSVGPRKANQVTAATFQDHDLLVVIKRGKAIVTYTEVSVTSDGSTLTLSYKTDTGTPGTAEFASPLVVSVPKGKAGSVKYQENGKEVGK
jgi:hypothetical protein